MELEIILENIKRVPEKELEEAMLYSINMQESHFIALENHERNNRLGCISFCEERKDYYVQSTQKLYKELQERQFMREQAIMLCKLNSSYQDNMGGIF